jgi:tetratricopeptide (TPR) repeat protein
MSAKYILLGLWIVLLSCENRKTPDIVKMDGSILDFGQFEERNFEDQRTFKIFQQGIEKAKNLDFENAKTLFEKALKLDPTNKIIHNSIASSELQLGNFENGVAHLKKAYEFDTTYYEACTNMAFAYNGMYDYQETIEVCNFVIGKTSRRKILCAAHFNKAIATHELKDLDEALYNIGKAIDYCDNQDTNSTMLTYRQEWNAEKEMVKMLRGEN